MSFQLRPLFHNLSEPNPVLVRELKQFVRKRLLLYFMLCYLLLLSVTAIVAMIDFSMLSGLEGTSRNSPKISLRAPLEIPQKFP